MPSDASSWLGTRRNGRIVEEDLHNYIKAAIAQTPSPGTDKPELRAVDFFKSAVAIGAAGHRPR